MKIVIDIDEEDYAVILANADIINKRKKHTLEEAVLNGTPLPKEQGRRKYYIGGNMYGIWS